jgi:YaiO family outer membrane protein
MKASSTGYYLLVFSLLAVGATARAEPAPKPSTPTTGTLEVGASHAGLTGGYPDWSGAYLRGVIQPDLRNTWTGELVRQEEFNDRGVYYALTNTHQLSPDWYTHISLGSSSGGFFFPRYQVNAQANKKWGRRRDLITTIGLGYSAAKDPHRDTSLSLGATYYFRAPWIVEGGVRWNNSTPGSMVSRSQFLAITQGRNGHHYLTLRYGFGREAYQIIGPATALADFPSHELSLTYRVWVKKDWGVHLSGTRYTNPSYRRAGVTLGTFKEF